jgi:Uma2 family endonuclease
MTGTLFSSPPANPESNLVTKPEIFYPTEDRKPLAESPDHFQVILNVFTVLTQYLQGQQAVVMSNQFLYYIQHNPRARVAPDVMVIFDVTPSDRENYKIWEEGETPKVVFEITSPSTRNEDTGFKYSIYEQMGVEEYWLFDPKGEWIPEKLRGYRLQDIVVARTDEIIYLPIKDGISQALQLRLAIEDKLIGFYRLDTGEKLLIPDELLAALESERSARLVAETEAQQEKLRIQQAIPKLRELGLSVEQIAEILGSPVAEI